MSVPTEEEITFNELDDAKKYACVIKVDDLDKEKVIIFCDHHKGSGDKQGDLFSQNERIYTEALNYYYTKDFKLIIAGDAEENWGFTIRSILKRYDSIFQLEGKFAKKESDENRYYYRIYGNHDDIWESKIDKKNERIKKNKKVRKFLRPIYGEIEVYPAIILKGCEKDIFIVHGHQGDPKAHQGSKVSKFFVRFFTTFIFNILGRNNQDLEKDADVIKFRDNCLYDWAKKDKVLLITGHTHRTVFSYYKNKNLCPWYFNAGACKFENGITGIEISGGELKLVKWVGGLGVTDPIIIDSRDLDKIFADLAKNEE